MTTLLSEYVTIAIPQVPWHPVYHLLFNLNRLMLSGKSSEGFRKMIICEPDISVDLIST